MHDVCTEDADHEKGHEQEEIDAGERASAIEPFGNKVGESNAGAPLLNDEVAVNKNLRGRTGVGPAQEGSHFIGKESRAGGESEEDDCSHPNRGIQNPN